jgi:phosphoserine phosphatase RsbU/P
MALLVTVQGPEPGRRHSLETDRVVLGRQMDCHVCLLGQAVSRQHAQIVIQGPSHFVEDLGSSNGTFLNGKRLPAKMQVPFHEGDLLRIGPYIFALRDAKSAGDQTEPNLIIREKISALSLSNLYGQDPAAKLQVVLEIAQHLARHLELEPLLDTLVEQLMRLLPQSDRAMVILCEDDNLIVRAQRARGAQDETALPYSRTIVRRALEEGMGILSDDVQQDARFRASETLSGLNLHSVLCVPLIGKDGRRLGIVQVDRFRRGTGFRVEDLHLLTTVGLQMAIALENAELHAERLGEQRLLQELAMAQDIQQGFLPTDLEGLADCDCEIFGRVCPARQVSGDLYDFFPVPGGKLAFLIGDVSGKGMPAALFMVAVHTMCRLLAKESASPAKILERLNAELAVDNPSSMFVTLLLGYYQPGSGDIILASAGHPPPFLRRASGTMEDITLPSGRLLGLVDSTPSTWNDYRFTLGPDDALAAVTDGFLEARQADGGALFGAARMRDVVAEFDPTLSLPECADRARSAIEQYTAAKDFQDDGTLLLLRRRKYSSRSA